MNPEMAKTTMLSAPHIPPSEISKIAHTPHPLTTPAAKKLIDIDMHEKCQIGTLMLHWQHLKEYWRSLKDSNPQPAD